MFPDMEKKGCVIYEKYRRQSGPGAPPQAEAGGGCPGLRFYLCPRQDADEGTGAAGADPHRLSPRQVDRGLAPAGAAAALFRRRGRLHPARHPGPGDPAHQCHRRLRQGGVGARLCLHPDADEEAPSLSGFPAAARLAGRGPRHHPLRRHRPGGGPGGHRPELRPACQGHGRSGHRREAPGGGLPGGRG